MANLVRHWWQSPQRKQEQKKSASVHYKLPLLQEPACTKLMGNCSHWLTKSQCRVGVEGEGTPSAHQVTAGKKETESSCLSQGEKKGKIKHGLTQMKFNNSYAYFMSICVSTDEATGSFHKEQLFFSNPTGSCVQAAQKEVVWCFKHLCASTLNLQTGYVH